MRVSAISGNMGIYGLGDRYRISSVQGNPYSMRPIQRIGGSAAQAGKPLVLASKKPEEELYVKDFGALDNVKSTAAGGFADMLEIQQDMLTDGAGEQKQRSYAGYLNDTIGAMGYQSRLREQLGVAFTPFA